MGVKSPEWPGPPTARILRQQGSGKSIPTPPFFCLPRSTAHTRKSPAFWVIHSLLGPTFLAAQGPSWPTASAPSPQVLGAR